MRNLCFLGDVWLPHPVESRLTFEGDFVFNLESPITRSAAAMPGKINLKADENHILETFGRAPTAVCLANNHIMDYRDEGFRDTVRSLEQKGIKHFGAGGLENNGNNPLVLQIGGASVALLGYAAEYTNGVLAGRNRLGAMPADLHAMIEDIGAARKRGADRIVVSLHWGAQEVYLPRPEDVRTAHALIHAGADLIIGHHAHCVQPFEFYQGKYIFYGLGNCIFPAVPIPAYFDHTGRPTQRLRNRLSPWNRVSLAVDFEPQNASVRVSVLKFDNTALKRTSQDPERHRMEFSILEGYERKFKRSYAYGKLCNSVMKYLLEPKLPRPRHVKTLISLIFRREYPVYD